MEGSPSTSRPKSRRLWLVLIILGVVIIFIAFVDYHHRLPWQTPRNVAEACSQEQSAPICFVQKCTKLWSVVYLVGTGTGFDGNLSVLDADGNPITNQRQPELAPAPPLAFDLSGYNCKEIARKRFVYR
jgi:hypothetical protein